MSRALPPTVKALRRAQRRYERSVLRSELLQQERDLVIREAIAEGMSHAEIHRALDGKLTRRRIGQIAVGSR